MGLGAIIIMDALGFKGIWAREDARKVLNRMKSFRREGIKLQGEDHCGVLLNDYGFRHRVRCMSDTIVVTVALKGRDAPRRALYRAMLSASLIAGSIIWDALYGSPVLLFRGCLAAGEMKEESDFLIGPAVDEAAERYETADGPFLWLAPSAIDIRNRYAETYMDRIEPTIMLPHTVPLKNGDSVETLTYTYFQLTRETDARAETKRRLMQAFGEGPLTPNVKTKKKNIAAFLNHVERIAKDKSWMREDITYRRPEWKDLSVSQKLQLASLGIRRS